MKRARGVRCRDMVNMFSEEEKKKAFVAKRKMIIIFCSVAVVYAVAITLIMVFQTREIEFGMKFLAIVLTFAFASFSLFFFSIKFRLTAKFVKLLKNMERGLKDETDGKFISYDMGLTVKDGLTFYSMVLDCKPLKREDITVRKVLVESTREKPNLREGEIIHVVTHANILMAYEILPHTAMDIAEMEEAVIEREIDTNTNLEAK